MSTEFKFTKPYKYPNLSDDTHETGYRIYNTPYGKAPSVTTILSTLPKPQLDAWKARVGKEEARRISRESTTIGTYMHNYLENYVKGLPEEEPQNELQVIAEAMAMEMKLYGLRDLQEIWGIEAALYCENLFAGRSDLIGVYNGLPSIVDYKTSTRPKKSEWIHDYKLQVAGYAIAHEQMFGEDVIKQAVILIALRPSPFQAASVQKFIVDSDELQKCKVEFMEIVESFYA